MCFMKEKWKTFLKTYFHNKFNTYYLKYELFKINVDFSSRTVLLMDLLLLFICFLEYIRIQNVFF